MKSLPAGVSLCEQLHGSLRGAQEHLHHRLLQGRALPLYTHGAFGELSLRKQADPITLCS